MPSTSHVIAVPLATQNETVKVCVSPSATCAVAGEIESVAVHTTVALALPDFELSAVLVAVTVSVAGDGGTAGAVKSAVVVPFDTPLVAIVPTVELPPGIPLMLHATPVEALPAPETLAV